MASEHGFTRLSHHCQCFFEASPTCRVQCLSVLQVLWELYCSTPWGLVWFPALNQGLANCWVNIRCKCFL